jgi:ketosteroid isomerase-like protein
MSSSRPYAEDIVLIDHRGTDRERFEGREAVLEQAASLWRDESEDIEVSSSELLASDGRVFASVEWYRGTARDGGRELEEALGQVGLIAGEQIERLEWLDPHNRQAILVGYAELGGGARLLGDKPPERWFKELLIAYARGDVVKLVDLHADGWRNTDHRELAWAQTQGGEEIAEFFSSPFEVADDHYAEVDEVLARDDRVIAACVTYRGTSKGAGGDLVLKVGSVSAIESGVRVSADLYDPEDSQAMLDQYAELSGRGFPR